jgi:hypothetical protein
MSTYVHWLKITPFSSGAISSIASNIAWIFGNDSPFRHSTSPFAFSHWRLSGISLLDHVVFRIRHAAKGHRQLWTWFKHGWQKYVCTCEEWQRTLPPSRLAHGTFLKFFLFKGSRFWRSASHSSSVILSSPRRLTSSKTSRVLSTFDGRVRHDSMPDEPEAKVQAMP